MKQIETLTHALISEGKASKKALQKLLGLYVHPFMHRRELMSLFHHTYLYLEKLPESGIVKLPAYVGDELLTAMMVLPLAECNIRLPVSVQISATDASSGMGGRASTLTTKALSKTLYRFCENRGEHVRMDWDSHGLEPPTSMQPAPVALVDCLQSHCWVASQSIKFGKKDHINLLELEMVKQEIKARANGGRGMSRVVNLCDSRVVVGAFGKGRSSSRNLNHKLRSCVPWLLLADIHLVNLWVPTDKNPADFPSRGRPIPRPDSSVQDHLLSSEDRHLVSMHRSLGVQNLLESEVRLANTDPFADNCVFSQEGVFKSDACTPCSSDPLDVKMQKETKGVSPVCLEKQKPEKSGNNLWAFREIFSGKGRLTQQIKRHGKLDILEPVEYIKLGKIDESNNILNNRTFRQLKIDASKPRQVWHFGIPCGSFSILQHSNGGTRRKSNPKGNGSLPREKLGNEILRRAMILISILEESGNFWTIENPQSSYLWDMKAVQKCIKKFSNCLVKLDQCVYGLSLIGTDGVVGPCKKPTRFLGNFMELSQLTASCRCQTSHVHAVGGVHTKSGWKKRSELAGHYPLKLCNAYAKIVSQLCNNLSPQ